VVRHSRSTRQRALIASLAFALAAGTAAAPAAQADGLKHKKHKVERSIKHAKADLEDSSNAAFHAQRQLQQAQAKLGTAQKTLAATRGRLTAAEVLDTRMQAELVQAEKELATATLELEIGVQMVKNQRTKLARYAAETAQGVDPQLIGLVAMINADDPNVLGTQMKTVGNIMNREDAVLNDLRRSRTLLTVKERKVQSAKDAVATKRQAAADNLALRQELEKQAKADEASVAQLVSARAAARRTAESAKRSDQAQLRKLKKENNRIAAMLAARAHHATNQGNSGGPLMRPVPGYVTSPFGWRIHPIYGYRELHNGTDFHAPCGTPERAAGNGRVIAEYFNVAWGNRLIVDLGRVRGHGVSVIYNHINSYRVHTGSHVSRGETLAYAGTTGWSTACHLHFTVMVDGVAQNPMDWF
jgi:murein DD-endopeptidase MepM/ murein hydrolase activator NlpD